MWKNDSAVLKEVLTNFNFKIWFYFWPTVSFNERQSAHIHDAPDGADSRHVAHSHVSEVPVLSWPHVHHPALVVWLLEHQPMAVHHIAGLAVRHVVTILEGLTVVHQLVHLASEVLPFIDFHPELSPVLLEEDTTWIQSIGFLDYLTCSGACSGDSVHIHLLAG